jgi:hypothetical protein
MMFSLLAAITAATAVEIIEMFTAGSLLAGTVYTAAKTGRSARKYRKR